MKTTTVVDEIVEALKELHSDYTYSDMALNEQKLAHYVTESIQDPEMLVLVKGNPVHSVFIGSVFAPYFSDELLATDNIIFVSKKHQGQGIASKFLTTFKQWAKERGATQMRLHSAHSNAEQFYTQNGLEKLGACWKWEVK